jgi:hypothetical protein
MADLCSLGGCACSIGAAFNDLDQIVGNSGTTIPDPSLTGQTEDYPALWYRGTMRDLGLLPCDPDAKALAIINVGQSGDRREAYRAIVWQDGTVSFIPNTRPFAALLATCRVQRAMELDFVYFSD